MKSALSIFHFLLQAQARGEGTALVTLTDVVGGSSRSPGAHLAVTRDGRWAGSLSAGCVEAAIVGEAQRVIEQGQPERVRFGVGSPFFDVRLPCGGTIDLLVVPNPASAAILRAHTLLTTRSDVGLAITQDGAIDARPGDGRGPSTWSGDAFVARHAPDLRIVIAGNGAETLAMARLSLSFGAAVKVLTTEEHLLRRLQDPGVEAVLLAHPDDVEPLVVDRDTAVVLLFHDHDRETALLKRALDLEPFYIGAMGSRQTHGQRLRTLSAAGVPADRLPRIRGPIGFIPATRDPDTLALSVLGEIVAAHQTV